VKGEKGKGRRYQRIAPVGVLVSRQQMHPVKYKKEQENIYIKN
jgi:hypothetical protein